MTVEEIDQPAPDAGDAKPPPTPRPKMTLGEQATFMGLICRRGQRHDGQLFVGNTTIALTDDDFRRLEAVWQTLMFMEMHRADEMLRDKLSRDARARNRGRS